MFTLIWVQLLYNLFYYFLVISDDFSDEDVDPLKDNEAEMNADSEEEADWFHGAEPEDADLEDELMEED